MGVVGVDRGYIEVVGVDRGYIEVVGVDRIYRDCRSYIGFI